MRRGRPLVPLSPDTVMFTSLHYKGKKSTENRRLRNGLGPGREPFLEQVAVLSLRFGRARRLRLGSARERRPVAVGQLLPNRCQHLVLEARLGELLDERGATEERTLLDMNRKRVREARAKMHELHETEDATRERLQRESTVVSSRVRDAVSYAEKYEPSNKKARAPPPAKSWDVLSLGQDSLSGESSSSDEE